jgi:hypothetical protein
MRSDEYGIEEIVDESCSRSQVNGSWSPPRHWGQRSAALHLCPSARPGVASARAAAGEGDHPPFRATRQGRPAQAEGAEGRGYPGRRRAKARAPLRARGRRAPLAAAAGRRRNKLPPGSSPHGRDARRRRSASA